MIAFPQPARGSSLLGARTARPHPVRALSDRRSSVPGEIHVRAARSVRTGRPRSQHSFQIWLKPESFLLRQERRPKVTQLLNPLAHIVDPKIFDIDTALDLFPGY